MAQLSPSTAPAPPSIVYSTIPGAGDLRFFRCEPYQTTISTRGCSARFVAAQAKGRDNLLLCARCDVGAKHAGMVLIRHSAIFDRPICPACRRGTMRMIRNALCVSCYNRRREMQAGRNARGGPPKGLVPLRAIRLRIIEGAGRSSRRSALVVDLLEAMVQALRVTDARLAFSFDREDAATGRRVI